MSRRASAFQRLNKTRKLLRRLPDDMTDPIRAAFEQGAKDIAAEARFNLASARRTDTGDLMASIDYKVARDGLTAVVGPGAKAANIVKKATGSSFATRSTTVRLSGRSKKLLFNFFKGYWLEFGTKRITPRPFMGPAFDGSRSRISTEVQKGISSALERAAQSADR